MSQPTSERSSQPLPSYTVETGLITNSVKAWSWQNFRHRVPEGTTGVMVYSDGEPLLLCLLNGYVEPIIEGATSGTFDWMSKRPPSEWITVDDVIGPCYRYAFETVGWTAITSSPYQVGCEMLYNHIVGFDEMVAYFSNPVTGWVGHSERYSSIEGEGLIRGWYTMEKADCPLL
jgi:hypothetical protein